MDNYLMIYMLAILSFVITLLANIYIDINYKRFSKVKNNKGLTGKEVARIILDKNNLTDVDINKVSGKLTDHYNPSNRSVNLSTSIYEENSISSLAVASHECGHAIQDKDNYKFMIIRSKLVPIVNLSSKLGYFAILIGALFSFLNLIYIGIALEAVILLFQLVTLPVEFDASRIALKQLESLNLLEDNEIRKARKVLKSAAMTYVASVLSTIIEILRLILIFTRRDD